jgi:hypothetical protein
MDICKMKKLQQSSCFDIMLNSGNDIVTYSITSRMMGI